MRLAALSAVMVLVAGCASSPYMTTDGYLGLADDDEYPEGRTALVEEIAAAGYYAVSEVELVAYEDYLAAQKAACVKYETTEGPTIYYCTETDIDLAPTPNVREWVRILERKKTTRP